MSRESVGRQLGFLAHRTGDSEPAMASEELRLVPPQRMENRSSSRIPFRDDGLPFALAGDAVDNNGDRRSRSTGGFVMECNKFFPDDRMEAVLHRNLYGSPSRAEPSQNRRWNVEGNGSASGGDGSDGDEDDEDDDDDLDEGDGDDDGLVSVDEGNVKNNSTINGRLGSSLEKINSEKSNVQNHHSSFGLRRMAMAKEGNEQHHCEAGNSYENANAVVEPEKYCRHICHGGGGSTIVLKALGGEHGHGFISRKEVNLPIYAGDSLRGHLSDPVTGILMDDAMILPCGHSYGSGGMQRVYKMKACFKCSQPVSEASVRPNLAIRAAVQAFCREEESNYSRISKRRRDRFEQERGAYNDQDLRGKGVQFPFSVSDKVIIKGNKRTPQRFVGRVAVVTTQCLNGWSEGCVKVDLTQPIKARVWIQGLQCNFVQKFISNLCFHCALIGLSCTNCKTYYIDFQAHKSSPQGAGNSQNLASLVLTGLQDSVKWNTPLCPNVTSDLEGLGLWTVVSSCRKQNRRQQPISANSSHPKMDNRGKDMIQMTVMQMQLQSSSKPPTRGSRKVSFALNRLAYRFSPSSNLPNFFLVDFVMHPSTDDHLPDGHYSIFPEADIIPSTAVQSGSAETIAYG